MFRQIVEASRQLLFLLRDVEQNKQDIALLKEQLAETNDFLCQLASEVQRLRERERHEREKFFLKVENTLLRFERQLPSTPGRQKTEMSGRA